MAGAIMAATAGVIALGGPAFADSHDNDGINLLNDNNISAVPIQLCNNDVAVIGAIVNLASPDVSQCVNAPITEDSGNSVSIETETEHEHHHGHADEWDGDHHHGHHGHGPHSHHG